MKVLYLTNLPSPYRIDFFNELSKYCDLTVLIERDKATNRDDSWYGKNIKFNAVFLKSIKIMEESSFSFDILKYIFSDYDLVCFGGYSTLTSMLGIFFLKIFNRKFVLNADGGVIKHNEKKFQYLIKKFFISSADAWICTGSSSKDYFIHYGADIQKIYTYPFTSLKKDDFIEKVLSENEIQVIKRKKEINTEYIILSVGQVIHRKGFDILLKTMTKIKKKSVTLYIIGGKETDELKEIREKNNITNVKYIEFLDKKELLEYYQIADLFILMTREDIWGLVINEALSQGLFTITSNKCGAGLEMINDENGLILDINEDPSIIADRIDLTLSMSNSFDKMKISKSSKNYTIENMAKIHIEIFNKIITQWKD